MDPKNLQARALAEPESEAYRGGFLTLHRQFTDAQVLLEQATRTDANLALAQQNLGVLRSAQNQPKDALAAFSAAIDLDPKNAYTRYFRAKLSFTGAGVTARNPELESDLRQAISVDANFAPPYSLLALYLASNGDHLDEAADLAQKSVTMQPAHLDYQFILAEVQMRQQKYDQAETTARRMLLETTLPTEQNQVNDLLRSIGQQRQYEAQMAQQKKEAEAEDAARRAEAEQRRAAAAATAPQDPVADDSDRTEAPQTETNVAPPAPSDSRIRGIAIAVVCMGNAMRVTVQTDQGAVTLHSRDANKVEYTAYVHISVGRIAPCSDVKGRTVRITTKDGTPDGEITALDIMK
jgi:tetratricopeptide (TPR) repeat protein